MTGSNVVRLASVRKARKAREKEAAPTFDALSFVSKRKPKGSGFNYWDVKPTCAYGDDCNTGKALAQEYLAFIGADPTCGNSTILTLIVREMITQAQEGGGWSGLHVGFLTEVNRYAMSVARFVHEHKPDTAS